VIKLAEDSSGAVIGRLYEAHGSRARARGIRSFEAADAYETDVLERPPAGPFAISSRPGGGLTRELRPLQIVTLRYPRR
jgi:alpha-mannosidase